MIVVNKRTHKPTPRDVYIGRSRRHEPENLLGNPFRIPEDGDRDRVLALYRAWLTDLARRNPPRDELLAAIRALPEDAALVCWCAPLDCHGAIIIEIYDRLKEVGYGDPDPRRSATGGAQADPRATRADAQRTRQRRGGGQE